MTSQLCKKIHYNSLPLTKLEEGEHEVGCSSCKKRRMKSCVTTAQTCIIMIFYYLMSVTAQFGTTQPGCGVVLNSGTKRCLLFCLGAQA
uniref:Uncharacterized protein n=1 Tax=Arundo donax TaxID=35708 RepID=A0A0A9A6X6_ARUDO